MTDGSASHFGSDDDLLSRYALDRLNAEERAGMDAHAAGCTACRDALRREMLIAAGARRLGRETLKAELKKRVAGREASSPWPRYIAAAAVLCLVVGFGVYYTFLHSPAPLPIAAAPPAGISAPIARNEEADKPVAHAKADAPQKKKEPVRELSRDREDARSEGTAVGGIARAQAADELSAAEAGEFWSDGIVTRPPEYLDQAAPAAPLRGTAQSAVNSLALKKAVKEEAGRLKDARSGVQEKYLIQQRPASALPANRRKTQDEANTVPTHIEKQGSTTTMTLYLDPPVDDRELKGARVEALRDDSVVVTLGGRKIMYRLQSDQQAARKRQK